MIDKIGRYEILEELGRGGMATVYLANDPFFKRRVALKLLPEELDDPSFRPRFINEARVIASLENAAIVPIYDFGEEKGRLFFVMRLMTGGSLADRLKAGPMPLEEASRLVSRIAIGLEAAHAKNVIHRDLKPANILFDQSDQPYLADFGLAKKREIGNSMTGSAVIGTPAYMSPEQGGGEPDIDKRSDIYALGVILFEMLAGRVPYIADNPFGQVILHITAPIPSILEFRPELPPAVDLVLQKAMSKIKVTRYDSARELAAALEQVVSGDASGPLPAGEPAQPADGQARDDIVATRPAPAKLREETTPKPLPGRTTPAKPTPPRPTPPNLKNSNKKRPTPPSAGKRPSPITLRAKNSGRQSLLARLRPWALIIGLLLVIIASMVIGAIYLPNLMPGSSGEATETSAETATALAVAALDPAPSATITPAGPAQPSSTPEPVIQPTDTPRAESVLLPGATATLTPQPPPSGGGGGGPALGGADMLGFISFGNVYVMQLDGNGLKQLTSDGGIKTGLNWAPDGESLFYISGTCVYQVGIQNARTSTVLCANWAAYISSFEVSPDGQFVAFSLSDGLYILPYDLPKLGQIRRLDQLQNANACLAYTEAKTKKVLWSDDSSRLAVVVGGTAEGKPIELVRVMEVMPTGAPPCQQPPGRVDEFPASRFTMRDYAKKPVIESFGWDGETLFALNVDQLNGFGDFYRYNLGTRYGDQVKPFLNKCCFRDFSWSPDNAYVLFAFQNNNLARQTQLFYLPYHQLGIDTEPAPLPVPEELLNDPKARPQPVLRPQK